MKNKFSIFILILTVFGGLFFDYNVWAQTSDINLVVTICGDGIAVPPYQECDPGPPQDLAGERGNFRSY